MLSDLLYLLPLPATSPLRLCCVKFCFAQQLLLPPPSTNQPTYFNLQPPSRTSARRTLQTRQASSVTRVLELIPDRRRHSRFLPHLPQRSKGRSTKKKEKHLLHQTSAEKSTLDTFLTFLPSTNQPPAHDRDRSIGSSFTPANGYKRNIQRKQGFSKEDSSSLSLELRPVALRVRYLFVTQIEKKSCRTSLSLFFSLLTDAADLQNILSLKLHLLWL